MVAIIGELAWLINVTVYDPPVIKPPAVTWEYRIESVDDVLFDSQMNRLGRDGWDLAFARRATRGEYQSAVYECIFKRPVIVDAEKQ
ncbi:hypothetical protein SH661x_000882 [Planctomicrobium sp. SH661]|uniref:hypothetical protein n=1 Tax=Planctomicrobium sp. SH661 TaxID=3448124 RepID=UPI003F5BB078